MHFKIFKLLIQYCFSKFFFINELYLLYSWSSLGGSVRLLNNFFLANSMLALLKISKRILNITFTLVLAKKNIVWINQALLSLFFFYKLSRIISNISKLELLIFEVLTFVWQSLRARTPVLTLLPKSIKTLTSAVFFQKQSG